MQDSFAFLILGDGRLREDKLIYVEHRENMFFHNMAPLIQLLYWEFKLRYRDTMYIILKHPVPLLFKEITVAGVSIERTLMICSIIGIIQRLFCLISQLTIYIQH